MNSESHPLFPDLPRPALENPIMERLLIDDFRMAPETIREILALSEDSRTVDCSLILEYVMQHAPELVDAWYERNELREEPDFQGIALLLHALLFLALSEEPENALGLSLVAMMSLDEAVFFPREWRGALWRPMYALARVEMWVLQTILERDPDVYGQACVLRVAAAEALEQVAFREPAYREEAVAILFSALHYYEASTPGAIPRELCNAVISALTHLQVDTADPLIERAYQKGLYDSAVCGTPEEIAKQMQNPARQFVEKEELEMVELYRRLSTVNTNAPFDTGASSVLKLRSGRPQRAYRRRTKLRTVRKVATRSGPKVGRNDPCPCGSGKKYKKCCGR